MARILIVEDEVDVLLLLENRLKGAGHEIETATDGVTALELITEREPDVVVLDWMMPRSDGLEVCERIRELHIDRDIKVLMLTARSLQHDVERAYAAGVDDFMVKPFSSRDLIDRVAVLAASRRAVEPV
jgi:CheY-like chemotaxis protein